jgi:NhaA family Na+:H+ antiporter
VAIAQRRPVVPVPDDREVSFLSDCLRRETLGGGLALAAAVVAVLWANSRWGEAYVDLQHFVIGPLDIEHWAADGALTLFFFVAGLELKREVVVGSLRRPADAAVPVVAAICGVAAPALIYLVVNLVSPRGQLGGWAIPAATDIAFAIAVLAVVGSRLPPSLRAFLLTLAVVDDLLVIVIIAVFYTDNLHLWAAGAAAACFVAWAVAQHRRVSTPMVYVPLAVAAWWFTHESGIHATIAGVVLGLLTRARLDPGEARSPAEHLEHRLKPVTSTVAVPFFALLSAGVVIAGGGELARDPVVLGVFLGLVVGKPLGVIGGSVLVTRLTHAELNDDLTWSDLAGVAVLAGIGFTVSLLVSDLTFDGDALVAAKTAVLAASVVSGLLGGALLYRRGRANRTSNSGVPDRLA